MDELYRDNFLVLAVFGGSVVLLIVGYLVAWRQAEWSTARQVLW
jgi:hypothetical protein